MELKELQKESGYGILKRYKLIFKRGKKEDDHILLVLDFQGLDDIKENDKVDTILFTLAILLSSFLIINVLGVIERKHIQDLHCISKIAKKIQEQVENNQSLYYPDLLFLLRDCPIEKFLGSKHKNPKSYLFSILKKEKLPDEEDFDDEDEYELEKKRIEKRNQLKEHIVNNFKSHYCENLPFPVKNPNTDFPKLDNEDTHDDVINEEFDKSLMNLIKKIKENLGYKAIVKTKGSFKAFDKIPARGIYLGLFHFYFSFFNYN